MKLVSSAALVSLVLASLFSLERVNAAGNEEDVLIENKGITSAQTSERVTYQCTFRNLWTKNRQPKKFPEELGRWAGPILWTHTLQFQPWVRDKAVTRGVEKLAEDGFTDVLIQEMEQQGAQVKDHQEYPKAQFFVRERDYVHIPPIEADSTYPFLSMMASIMPSPDWYTGFYSFWLIDDYTRTWYDHLKIQVKPWDAGTDAGVSYTSLENDLDPPIPIQRFVPRNAPEGGELRGPDGETVPVVGELECFLVVGDTNIEMPDCDWFANPCCNETDTVNCNATLPNGAIPKLSPEYQSVLDNPPAGRGSGAMTTSMSLSFVVAGLAVVTQFILV